MSRSIATAAVAAATLLAAPAGASVTPTESDRGDATQECRAERGGSPATREAFKVKYGANANGRNAFGKCVSARARDEAKEGQTARSNASKECKAEAAEVGDAAFAAKYGTGKEGANAHGKCVSGKAKQHEAAADAEDNEQIAERKNAAKACAAERDDLGDTAFADKYGANKNKSNAFGKCVSQTAKAKHDEDDRRPAPTS
jgi:hypothetical protein